MRRTIMKTRSNLKPNRERVFSISLCLIISFTSLAGVTGWSAEPVAPAAVVSARVFDVRQFGAKGDGKTLDTVAIQKAFCGYQRFRGGSRSEVGEPRRMVTLERVRKQRRRWASLQGAGFLVVARFPAGRQR